MDVVETILKKRIEQLENLLEACAEEIENCYGWDTELTIKVRRALEH
jgi:hypothetical protein